ncbi:MAG TPA: oligoendopeptidase F [Anaerolineales bacterium]|nr:oligoendopeptidase F [Anaerolineales bacterium]
MSQPTTMPPRADIPVEKTWDLESIFATEADWEAALEEVKGLIPGMAAHKGRLGEGPGQVLAYISDAERLNRLADRVYVYALLGSTEDNHDQAAQARRGQAIGMFAQVRAATAYANAEMIAVGFEQLEAWMEGSEALRVYAHFFERLEHLEAHVRSGEVEEVLALSSDPLSASRNVYSQLTDADMTFADAVDSTGERHPVGQGTIDSLLSDPDRALRQSAFERYADGHLAFKNTLAAVLLGSVKTDAFRMKARGYDSCLEASLAPNRIPTSVFYNLIDVFKRNLPLWHRYWDLRRRHLGYDDLHWYDTVAPLADRPPDVSFEQSVDWIAEGMRPLGGEYVEVLRAGCLEERWVDRSINAGKSAGAFSSGSYDTYPYILMSYDDTLFSLSTLAHELGHSLHSYYSRMAQPYVYSDYSLFVAEVASNFNQALTRAHLFESNPDRAFQLTLIDETMSNFRRYFFIMPTLARFELEVHERVERGAPVNADLMNGLCADLFSEGFGDTLQMDRERMGITWAQFGHLYSQYYVYQYATGIAGAHALAYQVLTDKTGAAAARYLDFLKAGGSMYPIDALKRAGVDLESPEPVEQAFETLRQVVDRLEEWTES